MGSRGQASVARLAAATFNVHSCVGRDGRRDPARVAAVLKSLDAAVIGLQEVDSQASDRSETDQAAFLQRATGMHAIRGATIYREASEYGNLLLTNLPVTAVRRHDLSEPGREPRGALDVDLASERGPLRVIVTHLGLNRRERRRQAEALLRILGTAADRPCLLLGDFNEWAPWGGVSRALDARMGRANRPRTYPSRFPLLPLDRIWLSPRESLLRSEVVDTPLARSTSDHLPVRAVIALPALRP